MENFADSQLYADELAAGRKDPGQPNTVELDQKLSDAERYSEATQLLEQREWLKVLKAVDEHELVWVKLVDQDAEKKRAAYVKALDELAEKHADLALALPPRRTTSAPAGNAPGRAAPTFRSGRPRTTPSWYPR